VRALPQRRYACELRVEQQVGGAFWFERTVDVAG
jgi:hypothetical protein